MAFPSEDTASDARTIYAKPFPKSTTDEHVREIFGAYGSVRRVKLRRELSTNSFRGSVYIEFAEAASAHAAVSNPPQQPHTSSASPAGVPQNFHVMMKADYERKRANASSSGGGGKSGTGSAHKRARHRSEGPSSSSQRHPPPHPPLPPLFGDQFGPVAVVSASTEQHQHHHHNHSHQQQQEIQHLRQVVEERELTVRNLEESLRKEREENQRLYQRLEEAQGRAQEATTREAAANQKALARDVEIGSLKGEISMLRTQGSAQLERQSAAHKARVSELEASLQRLKDSLMEKEREERELRKAAAAAAAATSRGGENGGDGGGSEGGRRVRASGNDGKGGGDGFLDDL